MAVTMAHEAREEGLNERAQRLLKTLVEAYIRDGQPVGSRTLSRESGLALSSATIRNVMADLEELGFVASPHTSAGRVPTDKGYRFFVDTLLRVEPLDGDAVTRMRLELDSPLGYFQDAGRNGLSAPVTRHAPGRGRHPASQPGGVDHPGGIP